MDYELDPDFMPPDWHFNDSLLCVCVCLGEVGFGKGGPSRVGVEGAVANVINLPDSSCENNMSAYIYIYIDAYIEWINMYAWSARRVVGYGKIKYD